MELEAVDLDLCRQWFDAVQDLSPAYLEQRDYLLAKKLYEALDMRVPHSILERVTPGAQ